VDKVQLSDGYLLIRPYDVKDVDAQLLAARDSIKAVNPWMPWCHPGYSIEESKNWIELCAKNWREGITYEFAITDSRDGSFVGGCGINNINRIDKVATLGYWVRTGCEGRGIATKTTQLLSRFGFRELKLNRLEILVAIENKASQRVAEKAGAKREGIMRNRLLLHDKVHDAVMFSLIPSDLGR
jgi:RimJ/RimL family protein N-acetyltransferase